MAIKQCVIFDMDGVIIDSEPLHQQCERKMFALFGITVSEEEYDRFIGATDESLWSHMAGKHGLPIKVPEAIALKKALYLECLKSETFVQPITHVPELIAGLHKSGFVLALASSSPMEQIEYILDRFGLKTYFNVLVSGENISKGKPNLEIFLKAAAEAGVEPHSCIVIEDSFNGVTAAKRAGMKCIGFRNPQSGKQDLGAADMLIQSFKELNINIIANLSSNF